MRNSFSLLFAVAFLAVGSAQSVSSGAAPTPSPTITDSSTSVSTGTTDAAGTVTATATPSSISSSFGSSASITRASNSTLGSTTSTGTTTSTPPDVSLRVPELHVGRIELDVDDLSAEINLAAQIANLVTINAGIQIGITKVNITISEVDAELELTIRLGQLVEVVNRTLASLDLNPTLIDLLNDITTTADEVIGEVIGAVDGLLGSVTQSGTTLNFIIDNLGNIVQEVSTDAESTLSTIVGNYLDNMTFTGDATTLSNDLIQKTYSYSPLSALVDIVFNAAGQVVQATVNKTSTTSVSTATAVSSSATSSSSAVVTSSAA